MRIAIIGAGNVGGTLGKMWAAKGHEVAFGVRSPNDAKVQTLVAATGQRARATSVKDAVAGPRWSYSSHRGAPPSRPSRRPATCAARS
jgi:predicted dinucleotide-binding enzyme